MTKYTNLNHPFYIGGEWTTFANTSRVPIFNPSLGEIIGELPLGTADEVDVAVRAAHAAFPTWADTPVVERARVMFKYRTLIEQHFEEIVRLISREHGKTYAEARGDLFPAHETVAFPRAAPPLP